MRIKYWGATVGTIAFMAGALVAASATAQDAGYSSHKKCKMCHNKKAEGEQWNKWTQMKHASAYETLSSDAAKEYAKAAGLQKPAAESAQCLRCHVTGYDEKKEAFHPAISKTDGVQCESCHGPGSLHLDYGKKMMMKKDKIDPNVPTQIRRPDVATCLKCHNDESPAWDPEKLTLKDGTKTGFDFEQMFAKIAHLDPTKKRD